MPIFFSFCLSGPFTLQHIRAIASELRSVEPEVRSHVSGSIPRLTALYSRLKTVLDSSTEDDLDPELEIEALNMQTKMKQLISAAEASVFKGISIKGPQEFAREAAEVAREARLNEYKKELALKWEIEDKRGKRKQRIEKLQTKSETADATVQPGSSKKHDRVILGSISASNHLLGSKRKDFPLSLPHSSSAGADAYVTPKRAKVVDAHNPATYRAHAISSAVTPSPSYGAAFVGAGKPPHAPLAVFKSRAPKVEVRSVRRTRTLSMPPKNFVNGRKQSNAEKDIEMDAAAEEALQSAVQLAKEAEATRASSATKVPAGPTSAADSPLVIQGKLARRAPLPPVLPLKSGFSLEDMEDEELAAPEKKPQELQQKKTNTTVSQALMAKAVRESQSQHEEIEVEDPFSFNE
jgi:hypothetical protein